MAFQSGRTGVTSSFNYNDIATGKSFVNHYGARASGAYLLMTNTGYSDRTHTIGGGGGLSVGVDTPAAELDFDIIFDRPRIIEGKIMVSVPLVLGVDGANSVTGKLHILINKIAEGNETTLVSEVSKSVSYLGESAAAGWRHFEMVATIVDVPRTKFKMGDTLRLKARAYATAPDTGKGGVGHDPKSRAFVLETGELSSTTGAASDLQFPVPFILDI